MKLARGALCRGALMTASALTALAMAGAEASAAPPLKVPWPCDVTYRITQGHNTGSHTGNGAWAWDIGIPVGGEVAAPADGTVRMVRMDSMVGGCSDAYGNDANYVVIQFDDGTEALLLHLEAFSSTLQVGDAVKQGDIVGRVGLTGWVCGAHLHFQIQQTCSSWWCPSVSASFDTFGDPSFDTYIESDNCGGPPPQCGVRLTGAEHVVDEQDAACFDRYTSYWWSVPSGHNNHHWFTFTTDAPTVETYGRWRFGVDVAGDYEVAVHIPDVDANSQSARYLIDTGMQTVSSAPVDQSTRKGWVSLGTYAFAAGDDRSIVLNDNTGENYDQTMRKLAYDAVRLTWVPPATPMDEGPMTDTSPSTDTASPTDTGIADTSPGLDTTPTTDTACCGGDLSSTPDGGPTAGDTGTAPSLPDADASTGDGGLTDALPRRGDTGCACTVQGSPRAPLGAAAAFSMGLVLAGLRRRRRTRTVTARR